MKQEHVSGWKSLCKARSLLLSAMGEDPISAVKQANVPVNSGLTQLEGRATLNRHSVQLVGYLRTIVPDFGGDPAPDPSLVASTIGGSPLTFSKYVKAIDELANELATY
ncbi:hypothetical protein EA658_16610 [Pseudoxanthomonas winnipegensis]|uniref:Uncharacterized protein n=1 Tax=Pseudoxanthomonas winnipegensis TaxID=2480810 RepID=A0ABY1WCG1_9GAMM|nr:hypothetical protein [Pseudoxanthomonas winnipegensis]TAA11285.1 hypothetical protein EA659_08025 [Pseudoxanthomonas winnipegensis]TAA18708.1 hypothetical protein EA658_16610 [Pseudoxanthomonas winnipegensis]TAH73916.1 hypothetical protein EA657_00135 [Pseudoxanthomonas winnipegensis]